MFQYLGYIIIQQLLKEFHNPNKPKNKKPYEMTSLDTPHTLKASEVQWPY